MGFRSLILLLAFLPAWLPAGASFFVSVPVQAPTEQDAFNTEAPASAGLLLVRHGVPAESAVQMAGPDGPGEGRIFTRPGSGSYGLTDAGAQWTTAISNGQQILGLVETYSGQFGWTGKAFVGVFQAAVSKDDLVAGRLSVAPVLMMELPAPQLLTASASTIQLNLPAAVDPSGMIESWVLWRKIFGNEWEKLKEWPLAAGPQVFQDLSLTAGSQYRYGVSAKVLWPGGGQVGAEPEASGYLVSQARSESNWIYAADKQPTPTPFPTVLGDRPTPSLGGETWLAYPNPNRDGLVRVVFQLMKKGSYAIKVFSIDGTKVADFQGAGDLGWQRPLLDLRKLASGIYLIHLEIKNEDGTTSTHPIRKLAIVR